MTSPPPSRSPSTRSPSRSSAAPLLDRRGDGRGAGPRQLFDQHQGAARLLDRAVRLATATRCARPSISRCISAASSASSRILKRHAVEAMRPGDVFIGNDAYEGGGTHLPDIVLAEPIFFDGRWSAGRSTPPIIPTSPTAATPISSRKACASRRPALPRRRAAEGRAGTDPAQLPGAARAAVGPARADGGQPARRARMQALCAKYGATRCWPPARRCRTMPSARCAPVSPPSPTAETIGGGGGARFNKDGLDTVHMHMTNTSNLPVEALEGEFPLTIVRYEMIPNSGGEGTYRGGTGIRRVYRANTPCRVTAGRDSRFRTRPWGAHGALPGAVGGYRITVPGQDTPLKPGEEVPAGGIIEVFTPGGGGYGPPSGRSREHIIQDMTSGVITADRALEAYGYEA
jgi:hypothetical protein